MILSKPLMRLTWGYLDQLFNHPLRTQAITSGIFAGLADYIAQSLSDENNINTESVINYMTFGTLIDGPIPYLFQRVLNDLIEDENRLGIFLKLITERLIFLPFYQGFVLYFLAIIEKKNHAKAFKETKLLYSTILTNNLMYLTTAHVVNLIFIPVFFRTHFMNFITLFWTVFIAYKRHQFNKNVKKSDNC